MVQYDIVIYRVHEAILILKRYFSYLKKNQCLIRSYLKLKRLDCNAGPCPLKTCESHKRNLYLRILVQSI